ncbi:hypothetical protein IGA_06339 [Bacillus cereus HuA3-9]|uniref:Uncharacterized protein n=1 Tax=Bacillus cereus HuA3-9 TaxID=1053205 RepID=R8C9Q8_BACCE|nr:hypothetical protein IGA_06339 [Bacillus cereus HuA3-9]
MSDSMYMYEDEYFFMKSKFLPYMIKKPEYGLLVASISFVLLMLLLFYKRRKDK